MMAELIATSHKDLVLAICDIQAESGVFLYCFLDLDKNRMIEEYVDITRSFADDISKCLATQEIADLTCIARLGISKRHTLIELDVRV